MPHRRRGEVVAAIDVGTNAVRLVIARGLPGGRLEVLEQARDAVRPGERLFVTGVLGRPAEVRLAGVLRRYQALCERYGARVRAVATSAFREAKNGAEVQARLARKTGVALDIISGKEEARLICRSVLDGVPAHRRHLCIDIGGGSTELALAQGEVPQKLWSLNVGAVRLTEMFGLGTTVAPASLKLVRAYVHEMLEEIRPAGAKPVGVALGSSGTVQVLVNWAKSEGAAGATRDEVHRAVERLSRQSLSERRRSFDARRADIIVAGAVILEQAMTSFGATQVRAVDRGLREGVLLELLARGTPAAVPDTRSGALALGRSLGFSEAHGVHVAQLALALFDGLAAVHRLPALARRYLEVAALLHDVGWAIHASKHHKHSHYIILNAELPGLSAEERTWVALIARFHRRSPPDADHELLQGLPREPLRLVRRCAVLLRVADALDRGHRQRVRTVHCRVGPKGVELALSGRGALDLELWDAGHEAALFRAALGRPLKLSRR